MASNFEGSFPGDNKTLSNVQKEAQDYLKRKKIFELFNFLIGHLLVEEPDQPVVFIQKIAERLEQFRQGSGPPPLLFCRPHMEALFTTLDRSGTGGLNPDQYRTGMVTLGISHFNDSPTYNSSGLVSKETFIKEATGRLVEMMNEMIQ